MLRRLMGGSPPDRETLKLFVTLRLLGLRNRRRDTFAGTYQPLDAGERTCAFLRGHEVLVVAAVRAGAKDDALSDGPAGRWRDVLRGEERELSGRRSLADLLGEHGLGVFERL
jgi:maltooligosyltrehalose synthase